MVCLLVDCPSSIEDEAKTLLQQCNRKCLYLELNSSDVSLNAPYKPITLFDMTMS